MPLTGDHHRGEDGVAGEGRRLRAAGDHQRDDQRHLDHGDGDGEHQRPERLTDPVGHHLGVVHGGEHRRGEDQRHERDRQRAERPSPRQRRAPRRPRPVRRSTRRERTGVSWQPWPQPFQTAPVRRSSVARRRTATHGGTLVAAAAIVQAPASPARHNAVSRGRSGPPGRCGTCQRGRVGAAAPRSRRTGGRAPPPPAPARSTPWPSADGPRTARARPPPRAGPRRRPAASGSQVKWNATLSRSWAGLIQRSSAAMVRISLLCTTGATRGASVRRARQASRAASRGHEVLRLQLVTAAGGELDAEVLRAARATAPARLPAAVQFTGRHARCHVARPVGQAAAHPAGPGGPGCGRVVDPVLQPRLVQLGPGPGAEQADAVGGGEDLVEVAVELGLGQVVVDHLPHVEGRHHVAGSGS